MSGIKVTRENPATPLPTSLEAPGDVSGEDVDWPTGPGSPLPLDGLSDVDAPTPDDGDVLTWDDGAGEWVAAPGGGVVPAHTYELANEGGDPLLQAHGNFGAAETIDPTLGNVHTGTIDASTTVTLSAPTGTAASILLWLTNDGTPGRTLAFAGTVAEIGSRDDAASVDNLAVATTKDGGSTWVVAWIGGGGGGGTPATTVTDETTLGITPAVGTDTEYARQDHTHGSPDTDTIKDAGRWELAVIPGSPPDSLYADGDWLYIWVP